MGHPNLPQILNATHQLTECASTWFIHFTHRNVFTRENLTYTSLTEKHPLCVRTSFELTRWFALSRHSRHHGWMSRLKPTIVKLNPSAVFWLLFVHIGALGSIFFFSWSAVALCAFMVFIVAPIGVTMTYHRMLTHRAFKVPRWLEYSLAVVGAVSAQGSPLDWAAGHRLHHRYADTSKDQHTPQKGFLFSHVGHLLVTCDDDVSHAERMKVVPDLQSQPFYRFLDRAHLWIALAALPLLYLAGGWPFVFWGGFLRVALMLHITWLVNSATHTWGYRNYVTRDNSRNCWWVSLLSGGEGWHNNHHAHPSCAAHGHRWWEFDLTWMMIRGLARLGLATQVKRPENLRS
jgi:stearoyl-CoA desaturase (delta-9 desaturase)